MYLAHHDLESVLIIIIIIALSLHPHALQNCQRICHSASQCAPQVVAEFFYPVSGPRGQQAVAAERSIRVQTRLNNIRDAIAVTQWADALPNILQAIQSYDLSSCQDEDFEAMQSLADDQLAPGTLRNLGFTEAASVLEEVVRCCGELSGPEKELFKKIHGCSAFWNFVKQEKFYGRQADQSFSGHVCTHRCKLQRIVYIVIRILMPSDITSM